MTDRTPRVYFAKCIDPAGGSMGAIKIGCSFGAERRVNMQTSSLPFTMELITTVPGGWITEAACHAHLRDHRLAGEFFRASVEVMGFVDHAAREGRAFDYFEESIDSRGGVLSKDDRASAVSAFMSYHGLEEDEVGSFMGTSKALYEKSRDSRFGNNKWLAACVVILERRQQYATWPYDCIKGLVGKKSRQLPTFKDAAE